VAVSKDGLRYRMVIPGYYGFVLGEEANAFFTTAESFAQLQDSEPSSQCAGFDRSTGRFTGKGGENEFVVFNAIGGATC
jgi:hypothetical protein